MNITKIHRFDVLHSSNTFSLASDIFANFQILRGVITSLNFEKLVSGYEPRPSERFIIDGIAAAAFALCLGRRLRRNPGVDLFFRLLDLAVVNKVPVYFLGATRDVNSIVQRKFASIGGRGIGREGFDLDLVEICKEISEFKPNFVFVALGSPQQESICFELFNKYPDAIYVGLGGSFDIYAGAIRRCPRLLRTIGLEWLYRVVSQPARLRRLISNVSVGLSKLIFKLR